MPTSDRTLRTPKHPSPRGWRRRLAVGLALALVLALLAGVMGTARAAGAQEVDPCADVAGMQPGDEPCVSSVQDVCPGLPGNQPFGTECPQVAGNVVEPQSTTVEPEAHEDSSEALTTPVLPRTGAEALRLVPLAAALLLAGTCVLRVAARREATVRA